MLGRDDEKGPCVGRDDEKGPEWGEMMRKALRGARFYLFIFFYLMG